MDFRFPWLRFQNKIDQNFYQWDQPLNVKSISFIFFIRIVIWNLTQSSKKMKRFQSLSFNLMENVIIQHLLSGESLASFSKKFNMDPKKVRFILKTIYKKNYSRSFFEDFSGSFVASSPQPQIPGKSLENGVKAPFICPSIRQKEPTIIFS